MVRLTYDFLLLLQEECVHEIIDGKAVSMVEYSRHDRIRDRVRTAALRADVAVVETSIESEVPDVALRPMHGPSGEQVLVEVVEHATRKFDEIVKREIYARSSISEYWIIDPHADCVKVYRRSAPGTFAHPLLITAVDDKILATPLLPGLTIDLAEVFAE